MNQAAAPKAGISDWKTLVSSLPGVLNVEFSLQGDTIREVHILSDQSRLPKQIVRDVQSAMLARYQVDLDHRVVSVAQIPALHSFHQKRLVCRRLEMSTERNGTAIAVHLLLDGLTAVGRAKAAPSFSDRTRAIALATVEAVNAFLTDDNRFQLSDMRHVPMGDGQAVLVGLRLASPAPEHFLGACYERDDPNLAAVGATLDAVNRRLLALPLRPAEELADQ